MQDSRMHFGLLAEYHLEATFVLCAAQTSLLVQSFGSTRSSYIRSRVISLALETRLRSGSDFLTGHGGGNETNCTWPSPLISRRVMLPC